MRWVLVVLIAIVVLLSFSYLFNSGETVNNVDKSKLARYAVQSIVDMHGIDAMVGIGNLVEGDPSSGLCVKVGLHDANVDQNIFPQTSEDIPVVVEFVDKIEAQGL